MAQNTKFALHMVGTISDAGPYVEFSVEATGWIERLVEPTLKVSDGKMLIPDGPGRGTMIGMQELVGSLWYSHVGPSSP